VIVCATGYNYDFPFLKRDGDGSADSPEHRSVHMKWDRHVVEPLCAARALAACSRL
jgi:hypothetical protein